MLPTRLVTAMFALVSTVVWVAGAAEVEVRSTRHEGIEIDGDPSDWSGVPEQYYAEATRLTSIAHDDRYLYLQFRFGDAGLARSIMRRGVALWVCDNPDRIAFFGLRYRGSEAVLMALRALSAPDGEPQDGDLWPGPRPAEATPPRGRVPLGALEVVRDGEVERTIAAGTAEDGPSAASDVVDGSFVYELRLPLGELGPGSQTGGSERRVALGIQIGGLTEGERELLKDHRRSGRARMGGGTRGGAVRGRGLPPGAGLRPEGLQPGSTLWIEVVMDVPASRVPVR